MDHPGVPLDPYAIQMILGISVAAHISLMPTVMVAHIQELFSEFYNVQARTHRLLWSLPITALKMSLDYDIKILWLRETHDVDIFYILGAWTTIIIELLLREEMEWKGTIYGMLPHIFPTLGVPLPVAPPHFPLFKDHPLPWPSQQPHASLP